MHHQSGELFIKTDLDSVRQLYALPGCIVVTAHRGFSGKHPENTLEAFQAAIDIGVEFVEFDVRCSMDGMPVIMHDRTVGRTTDGYGKVDSLRFAELRQLNASYWDGPHDTGRRLEAPGRIEAQIPTLQEALELLADRVLMNIQVYEQSRDGIEAICYLYRRYNLYGCALLMMPTFADAKVIREIDNNIDMCVAEAREDLKRHKAFGLRFTQPTRAIISPAFCEEIRHLELSANMFYANTAEEYAKYTGLGIKGIMSDRPDIIISSTTEK